MVWGKHKKNRTSLLVQLANMEEHPENVSINRLILIKGTPFENNTAVDDFDFVRTIAVARIMMLKFMISLSTGREKMSAELQALCFMAGANSLFYGTKLLTIANMEQHEDVALFERLNIKAMEVN